VSYGPFQLAELAEGQVEEVKTRVLRDQLGEKIAALAGADFNRPMQGEAGAKPEDNADTSRGKKPFKPAGKSGLIADRKGLRLLESLFNILIHSYGDPITGARVLDLFAGTGALGIEAISRGAAFALLVDSGAEARALLRNNVEALGLGGVTKVYRRDATNLGPAHPIEPFSLVFLDPPYRMKLAEQALVSLRDGGWMRPGAL